MILFAVQMGDDDGSCNRPLNTRFTKVGRLMLTNIKKKEKIDRRKRKLKLVYQFWSVYPQKSGSRAQKVTMERVKGDRVEHVKAKCIALS